MPGYRALPTSSAASYARRDRIVPPAVLVVDNTVDMTGMIMKFVKTVGNDRPRYGHFTTQGGLLQGLPCLLQTVERVILLVN